MKNFLKLAFITIIPILFFITLITLKPTNSLAASCSFTVSPNTLPSNDPSNNTFTVAISNGVSGGLYNISITDTNNNSHAYSAQLDGSGSYTVNYQVSQLTQYGIDPSNDTLTISVRQNVLNATPCTTSGSNQVVIGGGVNNNNPNCSVSPLQTTQGGQITVAISSSSLSQSSTYQVDINPGYTNITSVGYNLRGGWTATFNLPQTIPVGTYSVLVQTPNTPTTCTSNLVVAQTLATCTVSATSVKPGDSLNVTGTNFPNGNYPVQLISTTGTPNYSNVATFTQTQTNQGQTYWGAAIQIPQDATAGTYAVNITNLPGTPSQVECTHSLSMGVGSLLVPGVNPCQNNVCQTGLGNIPTTVQDFATTILGIAAGLGGGFALILMVIGAIQVLTSGGDQQKLSQGRERFVAAVSGLLFIIFAVLILQFIGLNILGTIPGF